MILRKWAAVAACMMAIGGPACAQSAGDPQQGQRQEQNSSPKESKAGTPQPHISLPASQPQRADKSPTQSEVYEPNCAQPKSQPDADLCVQRRVAEAAENALHWTKIQTWGALVGLVLVLATLGVTAWTGNAARIAAQAAVDAVGAERAWMSVQHFNTNAGTDLTVGGVLYKIGHVVEIAWVNAGRSPAINLNVAVALREVPSGSGVPSFDNPNEPPEGLSGVMGPTIGANTGQIPIVGDQLKRLEDRSIDLYIYSRATYETTSAPGVKRVTEFCAKLEQNGHILDGIGNMYPRFMMQAAGPNRAT